MKLKFGSYMVSEKSDIWRYVLKNLYNKCDGQYSDAPDGTRIVDSHIIVNYRTGLLAELPKFDKDGIGIKLSSGMYVVSDESHIWPWIYGLTRRSKEEYGYSSANKGRLVNESLIDAFRSIK